MYRLGERNRIFPIGAESGAGSRQSVAETPNTHYLQEWVHTLHVLLIVASASYTIHFGLVAFELFCR